MQDHNPNMNNSHSPQDDAQSADDAEIEVVPPPQRVRVAWLIGEKTLIRYSRFLQPLAVGLMDELVDILAICPDRVDVSELPSPPVEILRHGRLKFAGLYTGQIARICNILIRREVQVIHAIEGESAFAAAKISRVSGIPFVVSSHATSDISTFHLLPNKPDFILASSDPIRSAIDESQICPSDRVTTVRPGLHIAPSPQREGGDYRKAIVAGSPLIDFAKLKHLLEAFDDIHKRDAECMFFVVGTGKAEDKIRREILKLGLRHELTLVGNESSSKLPVIFSAGNIYVSPLPLERMDFWSLVAMSVGVPVVAVQTPASDHVHDGRTAVVVNPYDKTDLVIKLATLLDDPKMASTLAASATAYLRENHSAAKMAGGVAKVYRLIASRATF